MDVTEPNDDLLERQIEAAEEAAVTGRSNWLTICGLFVALGAGVALFAVWVPYERTASWLANGQVVTGRVISRRDKSYPDYVSLPEGSTVTQTRSDYILAIGFDNKDLENGDIGVDEELYRAYPDAGSRTGNEIRVIVGPEYWDAEEMLKKKVADNLRVRILFAALIAAGLTAIVFGILRPTLAARRLARLPQA